MYSQSYTKENEGECYYWTSVPHLCLVLTFFFSINQTYKYIQPLKYRHDNIKD